MSLVLPVIVAGGHARRFGSPKALAQWRGRALIDHVYDALLAAFGTPPVVNLRSISGQAPLAAHLCAYTEPPTLVEDAPDIEGPMAGIVSVMRLALMDGHPWVALCACDMPALTEVYWQHLVRHLSDSALAVVVEHEGRIQPMASLVRPDVFLEAYEGLDGGRIGPSRVLRAISGATIIPSYELRVAGVDVDTMLRGVNTPEELALLD